MKQEAKAIGRYVKDDVWSSSVKRGSHEIYKRDLERTKSWTPDSMRINAERILNGELVGEQWLYGRMAAGMIVTGLLTERQLQPHRDALIADMRKVFPNWESLKNDLERKHEEAMAIARSA
jgi:hypothetical protein